MASLEAKLPQNQPLKTSKLFFGVQICLRILTFAATLAATCLTVTNKQSIHFGEIAIDARYSYSSAFKFFAFANIIAGSFSVLSLLALFCMGRHGWKSTHHFFILFLHDLLMMSLVLSGCGAATAIGFLGKYGNEHAGWMAICDRFGKFCKRETLSITCSFMALVSLLILTIVSASKSRKIQI